MEGPAAQNKSGRDGDSRTAALYMPSKCRASASLLRIGIQYAADLVMHASTRPFNRTDAGRASQNAGPLAEHRKPGRLRGS